MKASIASDLKGVVALVALVALAWATSAIIKQWYQDRDKKKWDLAMGNLLAWAGAISVVIWYSKGVSTPVSAYTLIGLVYILFVFLGVTENHERMQSKAGETGGKLLGVLFLFAVVFSWGRSSMRQEFQDNGGQLPRKETDSYYGPEW
jgi:hypothetical protein